MGVVGQLVMQLARLSGARVIAVDLLQSRLDLAQRLGAYAVVDGRASSAAEAIKGLTGGRGADICIEASGATPALNEAIRACAYSAKVVAMGFFQGEARSLFLGEEFHHNRIDIVCSQISGVSPAVKYRWDGLRLATTFMGLVADGRLDLKPLKLTVKLERDGLSASESAIGSLGSESDLFAQGKLAMTWSDFTEATKYKNSGIKFGIMPFYVLEGKDSFVDTWTSPWGTFKDSKHQQEALEFLHFIATDAQTLRPKISSDPPLSTKVAQSINWGKGDSVTEEYLKALSVAPGQPFVPPLPEGLPWDDVWTTLQEDESAKAGPLLDDLAKQVQEATDQAWKDWDQLGT
jgi:Zinc-binding dehydrogenase/Bacterial extracellular solute-binding protein